MHDSLEDSGDLADLVVDRLGARGEGVAEGAAGPIYIPYAAPGDRLRARIRGDRGVIVALLEPGAERVAAFCPRFGTCGGCAVQTVSDRSYAGWKRDLVVRALRQAHVDQAHVDQANLDQANLDQVNLDSIVAPLVDAHGEGRRRATFHARRGNDGLVVGFMKARTHELIEIDACPLLAPEMAGALAAAHAVAAAAGGDKPLDLVVTASENGLDVDLRGLGPATPAARRRLIGIAQDCGLARLANHGEILVERLPPELVMGRARVTPPPGAFLQATRAGEEALAQAVRDATKSARRIADLFCGVGTFALRLAETAQIHAVEVDRAALAALERARRSTPDLQPIATEARDLFRRPLAPDELARFDAVVFDPPRAGAEAQARALARSSVPTVVAVSCAPPTFARDAALLIAGGYRLSAVRPFDQFRASAHVEVVAIFEKARRPRARAGLLG